MGGKADFSIQLKRISNHNFHSYSMMICAWFFVFHIRCVYNIFCVAFALSLKTKLISSDVLYESLINENTIQSCGSLFVQ